jgi:hypothetical protein
MNPMGRLEAGVAIVVAILVVAWTVSCWVP